MTFALGFVLGCVAGALIFLGASVLRLADASSRLAGAVEVQGNQLALFWRMASTVASRQDQTVADPAGSERLADSDAARRSERP